MEEAKAAQPQGAESSIAQEARIKAEGIRVPAKSQSGGNFWKFIGWAILVVILIANGAVINNTQKKMEEINTNSRLLFIQAYDYGFANALVCPGLVPAMLPIYKNVRDSVWKYRSDEKETYRATVKTWNLWVQSYSISKARQDSIIKAKKK